MTTKIRAWGAPAGGAPLEQMSIERRDLRPDDIRIDIKYAGICHSDIHTVRDEWGQMQYPIVPGHEIAGIVSEVGSAVTKFKVGDRAGVGCMVDSCGECEECRAGDEQYCAKGAVMTYAGQFPDGEITQGGYSENIVVTERFALRVPEGIALENAAPLMCAGITMYSPLDSWGAGPGKSVAIIGMGGLGHMGVKIASAMGAEVTVLSHSLRKKDDGLRMGASDYQATEDPKVFKKLSERFDLIVNTVSAEMSVPDYLRTLKLNGTMVHVGMPPTPLSYPTASLITKRRSIAGSLIGGIRQTQEMLDFCAQHSLGAEIEMISANQVNEAYDRVVGSDVRYRFVIDSATV